jgi:hypothetical protein
MRSVSFDQYRRRGEPQGHVDGRIANRRADANPRMFAPAGGMRMTLARLVALSAIDHLQGALGNGRFAAPGELPLAAHGAGRDGLGAWLGRGARIR